MTDTTTGPQTAASGVVVGREWIDAITAAARHYRLDCSPERLRLAAQWDASTNFESALALVARQAGLGARFVNLADTDLNAWRLPMVVRLAGGQVGILETIDENGMVGARLMGDDGLPTAFERSRLLDEIELAVILRPLGGGRDARIDSYVAPYKGDWFRRIILHDFRPYGHVMLASLVANIMALSTIVFSKQVYDRVIPAQSYPTLYVLFVGVMLAMGVSLMMRVMRGRVTDILGKRADVRISDRVFGHAIRLRNSARPRSTGTFIAQLRELEQVREMITSSTVLAIADVPFFLLFLLVFWIMAGPLVWIPPVALVVMILPSLLMQKRLAVLSQASMRESSLRNALLIEAVQGMEDVKSMQAEPRFQQQWNQYNAATAEAGMKLRHLTNWLNSWSQTVQMSVFAVVVVFGAPMVMSGDLTTGALVAASILSMRMLAPMAQLTQILTRWQQAKVAKKSLDGIMQLPVDHPEESRRVHRSVLRGDYVLKDAVFSYSPDAPVPALRVKHLQIRAGERIAVLGRNGAGKSTLLQALAGGIDRLSGEISLDEVGLEHIDPADLRRDVGLLSQGARLFHGTIRDNLILGAPLASDEQILQALSISGAADFLKRLPLGLDYPLMEGGIGLSGGQRQSLLLARLLLRQPNVLLLDEPTASLDENTEKQFLESLDAWLGCRTFVVATHRVAILKLVNRVIVVDEGSIVLDAPKDEAIARLST
ncbi:MAG: type I secretion system permease/ATPase [Luteimonas sp.]